MILSIHKYIKSFVSILLCASMILCTPLMAFAAENEENKIFNYVSIGASNTNGYGMRGYITEEELAAMLSGQVSKDEVNVYGYQRTPEGAYPDLIRDYYTDKGYTVNVDQLAISSMRVEELRILLDDNYMGDDYSSWRFTGNDGWFRSAESGGILALREAYRNNISEADLITVDIGWNNFGVYVCNQLVDYMSNGRFKWTTDLSNIYESENELAAAEQAKGIIKGYIINTIGEGAMTDALADIFAYSILGYMHNFDICMEKIYELNPDAEVVVLGIQNLLYGVNVELGGNIIPLGDIFGNFVNMANYYISSCSPYHNKYHYAKVGTNEHVTVFLDSMVDYNGDAKNLNQNIKDCFDYYDNNLYIQTKIDYVAAALIESEYGEKLTQFTDYTSGAQVVADGKKGVLPTIDLVVTKFDIQETFDTMYWPALYAAYDTLAQLVKEIANYDVVNVDGLLSGSFKISDIENALMGTLEAEIMENAMAAANGESYTVDIDKILPDDASKVVAAMFIRYYMGNSFFIHPNESGHRDIKNTVIDIIENPENEKEQPLSDYLQESVKEIHKLICRANGHEQIFGHIIESTCESEGVEASYCSCGEVKEETPITKKAHTYTEPVWTWTKTENDYTVSAIFTCSACSQTANAENIVVTYEVSEEPDCFKNGKAVYSASVIFNELSYSSEPYDVVLEKLEHEYDENNVCVKCGKTDLETLGECNYYIDTELSDGGTYILSLNGTEVGTYTFSQNSSGWTIKDSDGKYLSINNSGTLVRSDNAFAWSYSNGQFSASVGKGPSNWLQALLGTGNKKTTYYLVPSENNVGSSTSSASAVFYTVATAEYHSFDAVVHEPTCTEKGYTSLTCIRCGLSSTYAEKPEFGHNYSETVVEPTCTNVGYTEHACINCGDIYKENEVPALGHDFVDGICSVCGTPDEPECVEKVETAVVNGTFEMTIGGTNVGEYTFTSVKGGWTIKDTSGKYLGVNANGSLVQLDGEFTWTYSGGKFSASVGKGPANWLQALLGTGNKKATYYLVASGEGVGVSSSSSSASAKVLIETNGNHVYGAAKPSDGNHLYTCLYCGYVKSEECNDDNCVICNATVNVSVSVVNGKGPSNWLQALLGTGSKDSSATITVAASGTTVTSVAYSLDNGKTWTNGSSFTSKNPITSFQIRVIADNGFTYMYSYSNGIVTLI